MKKTFKIGDVILIKTWLGEHKVKVTRLTKTLAICHVVRADGTSYDYRFKKEYEIWNEETKRAWVTSYPRQEWNTNEYFVNP